MGETGQRVEIAGIVAVDHMDRQRVFLQAVQRAGGDEIAAVQYGLGAGALGIGDRRIDQRDMVVAIGEDAYFHRRYGCVCKADHRTVLR